MSWFRSFGIQQVMDFHVLWLIWILYLLRSFRSTSLKKVYEIRNGFAEDRMVLSLPLHKTQYFQCFWALSSTEHPKDVGGYRRVIFRNRQRIFMQFLKENCHDGFKSMNLKRHITSHTFRTIRLSLICYHLCIALNRISSNEGAVSGLALRESFIHAIWFIVD